MLSKIASFQVTVRRLTTAYAKLKKENEDLQSKLTAHEIQLRRAHKTIVDLENAHNHLRIAQSMAKTPAEKRDAKERLNKMIREIDKCLSLLSE